MKPPQAWNIKPRYPSEKWGLIEWGDALLRVGIVEGFWGQMHEPSGDWIVNWQKLRLIDPGKGLAPFLQRLYREKMPEALYYCRWNVMNNLNSGEAK